MNSKNPEKRQYKTHIGQTFKTFGWKATAIAIGLIVMFSIILYSIYSKMSGAYFNIAFMTAQSRTLAFSSEAEKYIDRATDYVNLVSHHVQDNLDGGASAEEIQDLLADETITLTDLMEGATPGMYGYVSGRFVSGAYWQPGDDYIPTDRDWYKEAVAAGGEAIYLQPYIDKYTGESVMTVTKLLEDGKSVVAMDVTMDSLQKLTEGVPDNDQDAAYAMIIDNAGNIITHKNREVVGENISNGYDFMSGEDVAGIINNQEIDGYCYRQNNDSVPVAYYVRLTNGWTACCVLDAIDMMGSIKRIVLQIILLGLAFIIISIASIIIMTKRRIQSDEFKQQILESEKLRKAKSEAEDASKAKSDFLANMSHEIRTPISAVLGMNEMILRECEEPNILEYSENIKSAGNTLLGLVNDILDFSKIEAGKIDLIPVDYDLSSVLNDLVNMIHTRADDKGLILNLDFDKATPKKLNGDEIRIKQIITNLLTNAVKYTEKGSITFSVDYEEYLNNPEYINLLVSVKDTGIGIKPEDIEKLFVEFERVDERRNRNIEGTGLGLSITQNLLKLMGSELKVESTYGEGSRFFFKLKQKVNEWDRLGDYETSYHRHIKEKGRYRESFTAPSARILVVDDNSMNLTVFRSLIKKTQINVDTAKDGTEGLILTSVRKYDAIFLDHMMPGKDGIETLHEMKEQTDNPNLNTPVVCLTANAIQGAREYYIAEGFNDYLAKPIDGNRLESMLLEYIASDKIVKVEEADSADDTGYELDDRLKPLETSHDIDIHTGIANSGSVEGYMELLETFYDALDHKADELKEYYCSSDLKNYTIKVHALKSSARIIGALNLAEDAQALENAGKSENIEFIRNHHEAFLERLLKFKDILSDVFTEEEETGKDIADEAVLTKAFEEMRIAADEMDCDRLEEVIARLREYQIPEDRKTLVDDLRAATELFDYDKVKELLSF